jgi:hypothetical protein
VFICNGPVHWREKVRAFDSDDVVHVESSVDPATHRTAPRRGLFACKCSFLCVLNDHDQCNRQEQVRDLETIQAELCLKDLQVHAKVPRMRCSDCGAAREGVLPAR